MTPETWKLVREWFDQASELQGPELTRFLDALPDPEMRREVETLLAAANSADSSLDVPVLAGMPEVLADLASLGESDDDALEFGDSIEQYEILRTLGQGGSGTVYQARHIADGTIVALKILQANSHLDDEQRKRFRREARMLTSLRHPNIVSVLGVFESNGRSVIAMEFVDGAPLSDRIAPGLGLPIEEALRVARGVAEALSVAHAAGITHRDLKPGNVLVAHKDGEAKLVDFGAAKQTPNSFADTVSGLTTTGSGLLIGSPAYMSPEQAEGDPVDARSDIFSFGSLLYETVTGIRLFERKTMFASMSAVIREQPEPLSTVAPQVPEKLAAVIHRCLRKDARLRFTDGAALLKALQKL
jgi:eukaryotic-like serine/threonine-protein kinase